MRTCWRRSRRSCAGATRSADLLTHLAELDERQLFLELGFSSLFEYCTVALGLCEPTAGRRVAAVRVCRQYPQAFARVANGELRVSALCLLKQYLTSENASELFDLCNHQGARKIEERLAARFPKPDVREKIVRLPARPELTFNVESPTLAVPARYTGTNPNPPTSTTRARPRSRRKVSASVTRAVYLRDQKRCTFFSPEGRRCTATHFLELDHIQPWATGGGDTLENLRLRCQAHNQLHARRLFGSAAIGARKRRRAADARFE